MRDDSPRLYLNTYAPLVVTKAGRTACEHLGLPPFIDGSIRREPDLEHAYPSISCLCRGQMFAPRLRPGDVVVYLTKKRKYQSTRKHNRLTAILRVLALFDSHAEAAAWYQSKNLPLPSNCMVPGNAPNPLSHSHRQNENNHFPDEKFLRRWDNGYQFRARQWGRFVVCEPVKVMLGWDAPMVHDDLLESVFDRVPGTRNPGALDVTRLKPLLQALQIDVPLSGQ